MRKFAKADGAKGGRVVGLSRSGKPAMEGAGRTRQSRIVLRVEVLEAYFKVKNNKEQQAWMIRRSKISRGT
jgi:hypothetical protein